MLHQFGKIGINPSKVVNRIIPFQFFLEMNIVLIEQRVPAIQRKPPGWIFANFVFHKIANHKKRLRKASDHIRLPMSAGYERMLNSIAIIMQLIDPDPIYFRANPVLDLAKPGSLRL